MIQEYSDFLPLDIAQELYSYGLSVVKNNLLPRGLWTNLTWHDSLIKGSSLVLCIRPTEELEQRIEDFLIERGILNLSTDQRITQTGTAINVWGRGSFIPEHNDHNYSKAITVYLNENWSFNQGGIFNWQSLDTGDWYSVTPSFNRAVVNGEGIPHGVSPVQSDFRITLQVFVHKIN